MKNAIETLLFVGAMMLLVVLALSIVFSLNMFAGVACCIAISAQGYRFFAEMRVTSVTRFNSFTFLNW